MKSILTTLSLALLLIISWGCKAEQQSNNPEDRIYMAAYSSIGHMKDLCFEAGGTSFIVPMGSSLSPSCIFGNPAK